MINRRTFLLSLTAQPVLYYNLPKFINSLANQPALNELSSTDYVVVGGWTLLKTDLLDIES